MRKLIPAIQFYLHIFNTTVKLNFTPSSVTRKVLAKWHWPLKNNFKKKGHCHLELLTQENVCSVLPYCALTRVIFVVITLKSHVIVIGSIIDLRKFSILFKPCKLYLTRAYALLDFI